MSSRYSQGYLVMCRIGHPTMPKDLMSRGVPEAEYLIRKGMNNGFKTNDEFIRITEKKYSADTITCLLEQHYII